MSGRAQLYEKYNKSNIFNTNLSNETPLTARQPHGRNVESSLKNNRDEIFLTGDIPKPINNRKYNVKNHESDIFNLNSKSIDIPRKTNRNIPNKSTCFDSMKDNAQFAKEIKDYTSKNRGKKTEYKPENYYQDKDASEILYNQYFDKKRNPITHDTEINKSYDNIDSRIKINNEKNEKDLFVKRKKQMRNNFTKIFFNQRNKNEKMKLEKETEVAEKNHKFYKTKGFTYKDNNYSYENKFVIPGKYPGNTSKINKQIQLQSNIFKNENNKTVDNIDEIKERIKNVEKEEKEPSKKTNYQKNEISSKNNEEIDRNVWGVVHTKWEKSNLDWKDSGTEKIFRRKNIDKVDKLGNKSFDEIKNQPFKRKMEQLSDSENKDTINESIKLKRKFNKNLAKEKFNTNNNLEKIDEVLADIPGIKFDKKQKILYNVNTVGLNGEVGETDKFVNYNKFHKNLLKKKEEKEPTIKIMGKGGDTNNNKNKNLNKNLNNLKKYDDYNIHDFVLSYDSNAKNTKSNFENFSEKDIKLLFSKKGIHVYDIQKNQFDKGKYNTIKFKVRENEGENSMKEKIKEVENDLIKKQYKICIEKDVEKEKKKNLRNIVNAPGTKAFMLVDDSNNTNNNKKKEPLQIKNNTKFTKEFNMIDHKYKK